MFTLSCKVCGVEFEAKTSRKVYCSGRCLDRGKPSASGLTCCVCAGPMINSWSSRPQGEARHNRCGISRGPNLGHVHGCKCVPCVAGKAAAMKMWQENYRVKHGVHPSTVWRRKFREANGYWPNRRGSDWIDPELRREIYERDGWVCYLCDLPVDREGDPNGNAAPSLDHVTPKSLGGSDDLDNLKTACRSCNSRKGVTV